MTRVMNTIKRFFNDEEGASVIEYAVLIALIAAGIIVIIGVLGARVENGFERLNALFSG